MSAGQRIWIGRTKEDGALWADAADSVGWQARFLPLIDRKPLEPDAHALATLTALSPQDWVFLTSPFAARRFLQLRESLNLDLAQLATVGPSTSAVLQSDPSSPLPALEGSGDGSLELAESFLSQRPMPEGQLVHLCAEAPRQELSSRLQADGLRLHRIPVYRTISAAGECPPESEPILVFSPSGVASLVQRCQNPPRHPLVVLGTATEQAAEAAGFPVAAILKQPTPSRFSMELQQWTNKD